MKNKKAGMPFSTFFFYFQNNLINLRYFLYFGQFGTVGKFLPSQSKAKKLVGSDNKRF